MAFRGEVIRTPPKSKMTARIRLVPVEQQAISSFLAQEEGEDIISFKSWDGTSARFTWTDRQVQLGGMKNDLFQPVQ